MDKREGVKGRRPEFCTSCSKAMLSYITTVKDFLDKVVEDIDINTPSSRREEGVLARTRIAAETSARDSTDGRRRSTQPRSGQVHQTFTSTTQSETNQSSQKESTAVQEEKRNYDASPKFVAEEKENALDGIQKQRTPEATGIQKKLESRSSVPQKQLESRSSVPQKQLESRSSIPQKQLESRSSVPQNDVKDTEITSSTSLKSNRMQQTHQAQADNLSANAATDHIPPDSSIVDHSSHHPAPVLPSVGQSSNHTPPHLSDITHSPNEQSINHTPVNETTDASSMSDFGSNLALHSPSDTTPTSPVQHGESKEIIEPSASYEHPPPLYSDHLAPPAQPEQPPLPIEEPSLPDGPLPSTWVEDMIRVCDIPLLLPPNEECEAYVTMANNNLTAIGCLVLGNSLRLTGTSRTLAVLITDDVTEELRNLLGSVFHTVQPISSLEPTGSTKLALLEQPELGINYSKLLVWRLNQFDKCVFLSPDTLVVQNCDELFQRNELSAVPDIGWPDFFNAGVFVYVPSDITFWDLVRCAENKGSFDGGDQGLLNFYFRSWALDINKRLPFIYNLMANVSYTYGPAFVRFGGNAKIVHFFGTTKPWNVQFNVHTGQLAPYSGVHPTFARYVQYWLTIFAQCVLPLFSPDIQRYTTMHGYVNAVDLARIVTGQTESAITFSPPSFRRYLDVPESVAFPAEKVQSTLLRRLSVDEEPPSEEEEEEEEEVIEEEKKEEDKEAEALADFNRMQAWEQGRIDYMGQDSSDNIMKKLDRFIKKGSKIS